MSDLTANINRHSVESIREEIKKKISGPYFANSQTVNNVVTDMDHHPYTRWFRGVYYYPDPIVIEREAGWRPLDNRCYSIISPPREEPHRSCANNPDYEPGLLNV